MKIYRGRGDVEGHKQKRTLATEDTGVVIVASFRFILFDYFLC